MPGDTRRHARWALLALTALLSGCLLEEAAEPVEVGRCGPRDLSIECCLKQFPGQWERCTGTTGLAPGPLSRGMKAVAVGVSVTLAVQPVIGTAEQRGVELASDLRSAVEEAIVKCTRRADRGVNDHHFGGKSPSPELCRQIKQGDTTTWAMYLGLFKHEQAWPCLREALERLMPKRYLLHPRFQLDEATGKWKYLSEDEVRRIVAEQGWKGLTGTIEPDIILLNDKDFIIQVFDIKFPCPDTNKPNWSVYNKDPWHGQSQGSLYDQALKVKPTLVSPRWGVEKDE